MKIEPLMRVDVMKTLMNIPAGKSCLFSLDQMGTLDKLRGVMSRAKKRGAVLRLKVLDGGRMYDIARVE